MASSGSGDPWWVRFAEPAAELTDNEAEEAMGAYNAVAATAAADGSTTDNDSVEPAAATAAGATGEQPTQKRKRKKRSGRERLKRAIGRERTKEVQAKAKGWDFVGAMAWQSAERYEHKRSDACHIERIARKTVAEVHGGRPDHFHPVAGSSRAAVPSAPPPPHPDPDFAHSPQTATVQSDPPSGTMSKCRPPRPSRRESGLHSKTSGAPPPSGAPKMPSLLQARPRS